MMMCEIVRGAVKSSVIIVHVVFLAKIIMPADRYAVPVGDREACSGTLSNAPATQVASCGKGVIIIRTNNN